MNTPITRNPLSIDQSVPLLTLREVAWVCLSVALLIGANMLVGEVRQATGWKYNCWQFTGFRALASAGTLLMIVSVARWRTLSFVGLGFGIYLMLAHQQPRFLVAALLAGTFAAGIGGLLKDRRILAITLAAIVFNVMLTTGALWRIMIGAADVSFLGQWWMTAGLRTLASLVVLIPLLFWMKPSKSADTYS